MADDQRLDGWKAIGNFLGRDRTTAIRWARERGLPVHRVPGGRTGTVYALASELSGWMGKGADAVERPAADQPSPIEPPLGNSVFANRRAAGLTVAVCALAALALLFWQTTRGGDAPIGIASTAATGDDAATRAFSRDLTADLARFANASRGLAVYDPGGGPTENTDYSVRTAVEGASPHVSVRVWLTSTEDGAVLWSRRIEQSGPAMAELRERVAANVVGVIRCSMAMLSDERSKIAASEFALLLSACQASFDTDFAAGSARARDLIKVRPDLAVGWATLAVLQAAIAGSGGDPALHIQARANAERAAKIAPGSLAAHLAGIGASGLSSPFSLPLVETALRSYPDEPSLQRFLSIMLFNAGYVRDSVEPVLRASRSDPTAIEGRDMVSRRLAASGRMDVAYRVQDENEKLWPGHPKILKHRERLRLESEGERNASIAELERRFRTDPHTAYAVARWYESAGSRRAALYWLARAPVDGSAYYQWSNLFWPAAASLRTEPAFFDKMAQIGLVRVWLARKRWPDFCSEPGLKYSCADRAAQFGLISPRPPSAARR